MTVLSPSEYSELVEIVNPGNSSGIMTIITENQENYGVRRVIFKETHMGKCEGSFKTHKMEPFFDAVVSTLDLLGNTLTLIDMVGKRIFTNSYEIFKKLDSLSFNDRFTDYLVGEKHHWDETIRVIFDRAVVEHLHSKESEQFSNCQVM